MPAAPLSAWETLPTESFPGKRDDISFVDATHGWYGTGKGDLYRTTDGGKSWTKVASKPGTFIRALGFVDRTTGFIGNIGTDYYPGVTDTTPLYRTDDGGATWTPVDLGGRTIAGVCAIDVLKTQRIYQGKLEPRVVIHAAGRVGGPTGILRSTDGGKSWSVIDMAEHAGMILDIKFFDERTGLVFASTGTDPKTTEGLILRTTDGGKSWTRVYTSGRGAELIWKASFPTATTGYATVQSYDPARAQQLIVKTSDGGKSWTELPMVENAAARQFGIGFVDADHGFVGTMAGGFETRDGGRTFAPAPVARAANKFRVVQDGKRAHVFAIGTEVQRLTVDSAPQVTARTR
ncbi:hypothetical protein [Sphingomonas sp. SFZ2018-12]|uniref:WD40/YVTN/BNR-like repeat-containing protein n=1 Tax=Sphingomonas sp. SFZ2018-12 TaxID=2683197 RepID=UPI001F0D7D92|nr:hypothetical protein [Sphingomonas sp. SFZ2018-12]